jgi:hypothetical protein
MLVLAAAVIFSSAEAQDEPLSPGQLWSIKGDPAAQVLIGAVETNSEPRIVHIAVTGLRKLERTSSTLTASFSGASAGERDESFWCEFLISPAGDGSTFNLEIVHLPIEYGALANALDKIEGGNLSPNAYFVSAIDRWDYLRDEYGINGTQAAIARKPLPQTLEEVRSAANSSISMMERIQADLLERRNE